VPVQLNYISSVANGKYVARMDADDMASPWRLEKQVMFLEENISVDLVSSEYLAIGGGDDVLGVWHGPSSHGDICRRPWTRVELLHGGIMGRREWFLENPYEPRYWGIEDQALLMKASAQSVYASIPEPLYFYRVFDTYTLRKHLRAEFSLMRLAYDSRREGYDCGQSCSGRRLYVRKRSWEARVGDEAEVRPANGGRDRLFCRVPSRD